MLIWADDKIADAKIAVIDSAQGPRSLAQFRPLVALSIGGVSREELDELADVSNSPALIKSLDTQGFHVGSYRWYRPGSMIWSAHRGEVKAGSYQYALTDTGARIMKLLMEPERRFSHPHFGYFSYYQALLRCDELFAHAPDPLMRLLCRNGFRSPRVEAA